MVKRSEEYHHEKYAHLADLILTSVWKYEIAKINYCIKNRDISSTALRRSIVIIYTHNRHTMSNSSQVLQ